MQYEDYHDKYRVKNWFMHKSNKPIQFKGFFNSVKNK